MAFIRHCNDPLCLLCYTIVRIWFFKKVAVHYKSFLFCSLLLFLPSAYAAIRVTGVGDTTATNIRAFLDPLDISVINPRNQRLMVKEAKKALAALGYYHPQLSFTKQQDDIVVHVEPGPPMKIAKVKLKLLGDAEQDPVFRRLFSQPGFHTGERLDHGSYEQWKKNVDNWARLRGYPDAQWQHHEIRVNPKTNEAEIIVRWQSGVRYKFGNINVTGSQIDEEKLASFRPFDAGDDYNAMWISHYNQKLISSQWFKTVLVTPDAPDQAHHTIDINTSLTPEAKNKFDVGGGFSTDDDGPRFKLAWNRPWVNSRGDKIESSLELSKPEQTIEGQYLIPIDHPQNDSYVVNWGYKHTDNEDTLSDEISFGVARNWKPERGWRYSVSLRYLYEEFDQGRDSGDTSLILPGFSANRTRYIPNQGNFYADRIRFSTEVAEPSWGSDIRLIRAQTRLSMLQTFAKHHRVVARVDAGGVLTDDFNEVPSSLRFFAGGDTSVRGYGYESLSPRDRDGDLLGGKYLLAGSIGYQYEIADKWWFGPFYDIGGAFNDISRDAVHAAYGVGVRWFSPVAPIRFDIAHGIDNQDDAFRIHIGIGSEL